MGDKRVRKSERALRKLRMASAWFLAVLIIMGAALPLRGYAEQQSEAQTQAAEAAQNSESAEAASEQAEDTQSTEEPVNFVLLLDRSGTMKSNDPKKLYFTAAKMFIDKLPAQDAKLTVIGFGNHFGDAAYHDEAGVIPADDDSVCVFYGPDDTVTQQQKTAAKAAVDEADSYQDQNTRTYIGRALAASMDVLHKGGAAQGRAAVILLTDGQDEEGSLNGKGESMPAGQGDGWIFPEIVKACNDAADNSWKVYALELSAKNHSESNTPVANSAKAIMRGKSAVPGHENDSMLGLSIPEMTGTSPYALEDADSARKVFSQVFSDFYKTSDGQEEDLGFDMQNGTGSREFSVKDMVAEATLTVSGDIGGLTDIQLLTPDGQTETYSMPEPQSTDTRWITYEPSPVEGGIGYVSMKLITPEKGIWKITCNGSKDVHIDVDMVYVKDMGFQLIDNSPVSYDDVYPIGTQVQLTGQFVYHGEVYPHPDVYQNKDFTAQFILTTPDGQTQTIDAQGGENGYQQPMSLEQYGTYKAQLVMHDSDMDRDILSNELVYTVDNIRVQPAAAPEPVTLKVNESKANVDLSGLFDAVDGDPVTYGIAVRDQGTDSPVQASMTDPALGFASFEAGSMAGEMQCIVTATDGKQPEPTQQELTVSVVNQPVSFTSAFSADTDAEKAEVAGLRLPLDRKKIPGFLLKLAGVSEEDTYELKYTDVFTDADDPEGTGLQVTVDDTSLEGVLSSDGSDASHLVLTPVQKGMADVVVTAADENDPSVTRTLIIHTRVVKAWEEVWKRLGTVIIIVVAVIIFILLLIRFITSGKKIYGIYEIHTSDGIVKTSVNFSGTKKGKKSKAKLGDLLREQNITGIDVGGVMAEAGLRFGQKVFLTNVGSLTRLEAGRQKYDSRKLKKVKRVEVRRNQRVLLEKGGKTITMIRKK